MSWFWPSPPEKYKPEGYIEPKPRTEPKPEPYTGSYQKVKKCFANHYYENLDVEVCPQCGRTKFKVVIARPIGQIVFSIYSVRPNIISWEEAPKYNDKECKCKSTTS